MAKKKELILKRSVTRMKYFFYLSLFLLGMTVVLKVFGTDGEVEFESTIFSLASFIVTSFFVRVILNKDEFDYFHLSGNLLFLEKYSFLRFQNIKTEYNVNDIKSIGVTRMLFGFGVIIRLKNKNKLRIKLEKHDLPLRGGIIISELYFKAVKLPRFLRDKYTEPFSTEGQPSYGVKEYLVSCNSSIAEDTYHDSRILYIICEFCLILMLAILIGCIIILMFF